MITDTSMDLVINTDGGSRGNPGQAAIGILATVQTPQSNEILYSHGETIGVATNNDAEYQAFLISLHWLQAYQAEHPEQKIKSVVWKLDSQLVVQQLNRNWKIKEPRMREYAQKAWQGLQKLPFLITIAYVPRAENAAADALVNAALDQTPLT